jgi:Secretion system C-terminal sorting domain
MNQYFKSNNMKTQFAILAFTILVMFTGNAHAQYGGHTPVTATGYLGAGSTQGVFADITYNDGAISSSPSSTVYFTGSAPNTQHQILANIGGAVATQIGNVILNNGTGGLLINNTNTGLEIITNFNFNAQNAQVTTLRNSSSVLNNNLHIGANAGISGYNATNNINGYLKKDGDAAGFTFPLADGANYAPMTVGALGAGNSLTAAYYKASGNTALAFEGGTFSVSSFASPLLSVSPLEYWDVSATGTPNAPLSLIFQGNYSVASLPTLFIVGWRTLTSRWELIPGGFATGLTPGNTISSTGNVDFSIYSAFTLAATTIVLPFNLISFNAEKWNNNRQILLTWITASESNLNNHTVERSADGSSGWLPIGKLAAINAVNGSSYSLLDNSPLEGNNYYRLKTVSNDKIITYSSIRAVTFSKPGFSITLYPNPVIGVVNISISGNINRKYTIQIKDATGKVLQKKINIGTETKCQFDVSRYSKGLYYLNLFDGNNILVETKKFIKQ